jgi:tetratricopeptide (TPR) repeat protein
MSTSDQTPPKSWVFVSHSNKDIDAVRLIRDELERSGHYPLLFFLYCDSPEARDSKWVQRELDFIRALPNRVWCTVDLDSEPLAQVRAIQELSRRGSELNQRGNIETAARLTEPDVARYAVLGNCRQAPENSAQAQTLARALIFNARSNTAVMRPIALAMCGEIAQAQSLVNELAKENPKDTAINAFWLPTIRAAIEIRKDNAAGAIQLLQAVGPYEAATFFWPNYIRAQAYLRQKAGPEARAEFQKILDHRGWDPTSYLYPLAHLGLARAAALAGDVARSRKAYQDFLTMWKDADVDLPILIEAKKEYAGLKREMKEQ